MDQELEVGMSPVLVDPRNSVSVSQPKGLDCGDVVIYSKVILKTRTFLTCICLIIFLKTFLYYIIV